MIVYQDNFVSNDLFLSLNKRMLERYDPKLSIKRGVIKNYKATATRLAVSLKDKEYEEAKVLLGTMVPSIINSVKTFLISDLKFKNPKTYNAWFQYQTFAQKVGKHFDHGYIDGKRPYQCFSTFIYTHLHWDVRWGGEICFHSMCLEPKSNRLVIYSRDEEHWVNEFKSTDDDYLRMFLGIDWSTENDFQ